MTHSKRSVLVAALLFLSMSASTAHAQSSFRLRRGLASSKTKAKAKAPKRQVTKKKKETLKAGPAFKKAVQGLDTFYRGKLVLKELTAKVNLAPDRGDVACQYRLLSNATTAKNYNLTAVRTGFAGLKDRTTKASKASFARADRSVLGKLQGKKLAASFQPKEQRVLDLAYSSEVAGRRFKSFQFVPMLTVGEKALMSRVARYKVSFHLPATAKKVVTSTIPPSAVRQTPEGLVCEFDTKNALPLPISVKWTEHDVDVELTKTLKKLPDRHVRVSIRVDNKSSAPVDKLLIEDSYSDGEAQIVLTSLKLGKVAPKGKKGKGRTASRRGTVGKVGVRKVGPARASTQGTKVGRATSKATSRPAFLRRIDQKDSDPRLVFRREISLEPRASKTVTYTIKAKRHYLNFPQTVAKYQGSVVAVAPSSSTNWPPPGPLPKAAFAVPTGWSFNFANPPIFHPGYPLFQTGLWLKEQHYLSKAEKLWWTTEAVFSNKYPGSAPYEWAFTNQVLKFNPGFAHHGQSNWIRGKRTILTHEHSYTDPKLMNFNNAVLLLRGWYFQFRDGSHAVQKMSIKVANCKFDRLKGKVTWRVPAQLYEKGKLRKWGFKYYYTVLGFNGMALRAPKFPTDGGGSAASTGSYAHKLLKGYAHGMVIPTAWSVSFQKGSSLLDTCDFNILNVKYKSSTGAFSWTAHADYSSPNVKPPYSYGYTALCLATNDGDAREYRKGPIQSDHQFSNVFCPVGLSHLFKPITWTNGVKDGDETGVDCGGRSPARDLKPLRLSVNPGHGPSSGVFCINSILWRDIVRLYATIALLEYAAAMGQDYAKFYQGPAKADRYVEAVAWYVDHHMHYLSDEGDWKGSQSSITTLLFSGGRGPGDFNGDCEDHAILRAALLRSLGFYHAAILCADHHNSVDQGHLPECDPEEKKKKSGGHTFNIVVYKGKYRILDYGTMRIRMWANRQAWAQHVVDNIWNDHVGQHWKSKNVSPFGSPLVNYPGNPCNPSPNWDWRTYFGDVTQ